MSVSRRLAPSLALTTALALAGCWGPAAPTPPAESPAAPVNPAAPAAPATENFTTLEGTVAMRGAPWAQAKLQVVDALTGKPAGTEGSALRAEGTMETDAEGRFSIRVAGLGAGKVARVIATSENRTLTALVSEEAPVTRAYTVLQSGALSLNVTELTLCLDQVASGVLKMAGGLKSESAAALIKDLLKDLAAMAPKLEEAFAKDASLALTLAVSADPQTGLVATGENVTKALQSAGLGAAVDQAVKTAALSIAEQAKDKLNVADSAALENVTLIGTTLKVAVTGGAFTVTDPATGESISFDLSAPVSETPTAPTAPTGGSGGGSDTTTVTTPFAPVATFGTSADTIRLKVTQAAGESDIAALVVKVPVVAAIGAVQVTNLTQSNPAGSIAGAGGEIAVGSALKLTLGVSADQTVDMTGMTAAPFGATLNYNAGVEKDGHLIVPAMDNAVLGHVRVFTGNSTLRWWGAENLYVAAKYTDRPEFANANSLKTTQGHATHLDFTLPAGVTFTNNSSLVIQVHIAPRAAGVGTKIVTATYDANILTP